MAHLNVSHNCLTKLPISSKNLEFLDISHNNFSDLGHIFHGNPLAESLIFLNVKGNPLETGEIAGILNKLPSLEFFNGKFFGKVKENALFLNETAVSEEIIYENAKFFQDFAVENDKGTVF